MKAWRLLAVGDHRLVEVPLPSVGDRDVLVKVKVVQASVTDSEVLKGLSATPSSRLIPKWLAEGRPVQRGHEYCGEVVEAGKGVISLRVGDRVSSPSRVYCGSCKRCVAGRFSECLSPHHIGGDIPGAFAEYMSIAEWGVVKMPTALTDNEIATLQSLCSCVSSVHSAGIAMGDSVVILGQGAMGLGILQAARLAGAGQLIAVARRPETLALSRKLGAYETINTREVDVVSEVLRLTDGIGADVVFDAAGGNTAYGLSGFQTVAQAFRMVRSGGKVVQTATLDAAMELDVVSMRARAISYVFPEPASISSMELAALWMATGRIEVKSQITHVLHGLDRLPEAIDITENKAKYGAISAAQVVV